jgi:hypothetical protein
MEKIDGAAQKITLATPLDEAQGCSTLKRGIVK